MIIIYRKFLLRQDEMHLGFPNVASHKIIPHYVLNKEIILRS